MLEIRISIVFGLFMSIYMLSLNINEVYSQQYNFTNYSIENGLAQSQVYALYEDSRGYIWIGTDGGGISMFDGINFKNLTKEDGLSSNQVRSIFEDHNGNMWFGTKDGFLNKYDGKKFKHYNEKHGVGSPTIWTIAEDLSGNILVGCERSGIYRMKDDIFKKVEIIQNDSIELTVKSIFVSSEGILWIGTQNNGCFVYDNLGFKQKTKANGLIDNHIYAINEDHKGNIWLGTKNGISKFNGSDFTTYTEEDGLCGNQIRAISVDNIGNIWFGSQDQGASRFDGKQFYTFEEANGLCYDFVMSMTCDRNGNMWFGTDGGGICKFEGERFVHITEDDGLAGNLVMSIEEDSDSNIWFGTYGNGASVYNGTSIKSYTKEEGLCSNLIYVIKQVKSGHIWFGSKGGGISVFNGISFTNYNTSNKLQSNLVYCIMEDRLGNIWIGTLGSGVSIFDGKEFTTIGKNNGLSSDYIYDIFEDNDGNIWIGTDDAGALMILADCSSNDLIREKYISENQLVNIAKYGLTSKQVLSIAQDKYSNIWIATFGEGLFRYDGEILKNYTINDGMNSNNIYLQLIDGSGYLWTGTERGLNQLDIRENSIKFDIKTFSSAEGFVGIETNFNAAIEDYLGNLWFGNLSGATVYNPNADLPNEKAPLINITEIKLFFENTDWSKFTKDISSWGNIPKDLILPYDDNHLTFEFIGIDHKSPRNVQYQTILEGFDKNWSPLSTKREITYQYIPPGKYTFKVKAINSDGVGTKSPVAFNFEIPPPFWQTWWARAIGIAHFVLIIVLIFYWRTASLKRRQKELEHTVKERTEEVQEKNKELLHQNEEIAEQRDLVIKQKVELEKLSIVASETDNAVLIMDGAGSFEWANKGFEKLFHHNLNDYMAKFGHNIFEASTSDEIKKIIQECINTGQSVTYNSSFDKIDGHPIHLQTTLTPIHDENGDLKKLVAIDSDITELKNIQSQLVESEKMASLGNLVAGVAHEINTPVGIGITASSALLDKTTEIVKLYKSGKIKKSELEAYFNTAYNSSKLLFSNLERTGELVQSFKQVSVDQSTDQKREFNIKSYFEDILRSLAPKLKNTNISITLDCPEEIVINSYPGPFAQIITNLVDNSLIHAFEEDQKGQIKINVKKDNAKLVIMYADDGKGMTNEVKEKIFDPFYTTNKQEGTGLGMHILYNLVTQKLGGAILVESEVGNGVTCEISLPINEKI